MNDDELVLVRAEVAQLPAGVRGHAAISAARGIAAALVRPEREGARSAPGLGWSAVSWRWISLGALQLTAELVAGLSHLGGRGGRLSPEGGAIATLVSVPVAIALAVLLRRFVGRMPLTMAGALRPIFLVGAGVGLVGLVLGPVRVALGEADDPRLVVAATVALAVGSGTLFLLGRGTPSSTAILASHALSDAEATDLRGRSPHSAQRMRDAEMQALRELRSLQRLTREELAAEAVRTDQRWGGAGTAHRAGADRRDAQSER